MSGLHHSVPMAFGVKSVFKEKGYYKTADGTKMIRKTKDTRDQITARYQIIEHCINAGYPWVDKYYLAQSGQPYVFSEGEYYIMTDLIKHKEADFADPAEFLQITQSTAQWHQAARGVSLTAPLQKGRPPALLTETIQTQGEAMDVIYKRIRKQSKWSDFDVLFLKNYHTYRNRIQESLKILQNTGYLQYCEHARKHQHITHGALKESCIRISADQVYITKHEQAAIDYQLTDLCALVRRREKTHTDLDRSQIIEAYSQILPLQPDEAVILEAMLLYPQAFIKLTTEYYRKKRTWTPGAMISKMEEILSNP